ncbi:hypothetical protein [Pseudoduganella sp. OTU4001]|uniref:hypothetical protein n=1 Tax=Pseudoduganella sp. OTU4001 TaxID=3043854 RepID=UPI00313B5CB7
MALQLKKTMVWNSAITSGLCVVVAVVIAQVADLHEELLWLAALAASVALLTFFRAAHRIRRDTLAPLLETASYVRIARDSLLVRDQVDWSVIDDYAAQLAMRGFRPLGDYTAYPMPGALVGVAAMFTDADASIMIEIQQLKLLPSAGPERMRDGIYFSITSLVGGQIRVITCNHKPQAATYLVRGDHDILNAEPDKGLLALLAQHTDMLMRLRQKVGKTAAKGLTVERYVLSIREAQAQARRRLSAMSGYAIAGVVDEFEARAKRRWAPSTPALKAVPLRALEELDTAYAVEGQPPVFQESLSW